VVGNKETKKTKIDKILNLLKNEDLTASEIASRINSHVSYVYQLLYRLEVLGKIERKNWLGAFSWGLKSDKNKKTI
jgi:predicted transcriptional regulator